MSWKLEMCSCTIHTETVWCIQLLGLMTWNVALGPRFYYNILDILFSNTADLSLHTLLHITFINCQCLCHLHTLISHFTYSFTHLLAYLLTILAGSTGPALFQLRPGPPVKCPYCTVPSWRSCTMIQIPWTWMCSMNSVMQYHEATKHLLQTTLQSVYVIRMCLTPSELTRRNHTHSASSTPANRWKYWESIKDDCVDTEVKTAVVQKCQENVINMLLKCYHTFHRWVKGKRAEGRPMTRWINCIKQDCKDVVQIWRKPCKGQRWADIYARLVAMPKTRSKEVRPGSP